MKKPEKTKKLIRTAALLLAAAILAAGLFYLCYQVDNKYTAAGPQAVGGVLMLNEEDLQQYSVIYLVRDWEIYRNRLLSPEDFAQNSQFLDELTFIGQYGGFEGHVEGAADRSPHGSATYRLNIALPAETKSYMLELPEIYSAYKLYINGTLMAQMGDPDPQSYQPQTGNSFVMVQASERMEILIAVSDYSHIYSGMVYPPAFGEPSAVSRLINIRYGLRAAVCAIALCIGLLYLLVGILTKTNNPKPRGNALTLLYSTLCACYVLYICYPIIKTLFPGGTFLYAIDNFAYCAMLLLVMFIQNYISGMGSKWTKVFSAFGVFACCWALLVPHFATGSLNLLMVYSRIIGLYAWVCTLYLTASTAYGVYKGIIHSKTMLAGMAVFGAALVMDRLFPMFEPIRLGWFTELAGGVLVALIGFVMATEVAGQFRQRLVLESRVESTARLLALQREQYGAMTKSSELARAARHDLRHQLAVLKSYGSVGDLQKLNDYLEELTGGINNNDEDVLLCDNYAVNAVARHYLFIAKSEGIEIDILLDIPERTGQVPDTDLCIVVGNLLENALEACRRMQDGRRFIRVRSKAANEYLSITVDNSFDGVWRQHDGVYLSRKRDGEGIGLSSVRAVTEKYDGYAEFRVDGNTFLSSALVNMNVKATDG